MRVCTGHVMVACCPPVLEHVCIRESVIVTEGEKTSYVLIGGRNKEVANFKF